MFRPHVIGGSTPMSSPSSTKTRGGSSMPSVARKAGASQPTSPTPLAALNLARVGQITIFLTLDPSLPLGYGCAGYVELQDVIHPGNVPEMMQILRLPLGNMSY